MQDFSCPALLRCRLDPKLRFRVRGCHPLRLNFPVHSAIIVLSSQRRSFNPGACRNRTGLGSCAFARHYLRNHYCFLFLRLLRCFSSPGLPRALRGAAEAAGCPIRKSMLMRVFAPGHGLSQLVTSFFASESQGILHVPFSPFLVS